MNTAANLRWTDAQVTSDQGGVIVSWLLKVAIVLAVGAVVIFDAISLGYSHTAVLDDARAVARSASHSVLAQENDTQIVRTAQQTADERGVELVVENMTLDENGAVTVTVRRTAPTLLMHRIPPLREFLVTTASSSSSPLTF